MTRTRQFCGALALALALAFSALGRAGRASAAPGDAPEARSVRKLGGAHGSKVEVAPAADPGTEADHSDVASQGRQTLQQAREQAREAMKEAREAMQKAPKDTRAAVEQAREAMKEAREQAREAIEKAPDEAREKMQDAREEVKKAREQGREAIEEAKAAMEKARERMQQALPGLPGADSRKDQARYARRLAWHALMNRVGHPSQIAPAAREELRHHAQRMAKLQRIHALAAGKHDTATMARCDKLLAREEVRHRARLAAVLPLQAQGQAPGQAPAAAAREDDEPGEAEGAEDEEQEGEP